MSSLSHHILLCMRVYFKWKELASLTKKSRILKIRLSLFERIVFVQEVTAVVGKCAGVVLMAPPHGNKEAEATIATLLSAMKSKQKVRQTNFRDPSVFFVWFPSPKSNSVKTETMSLEEGMHQAWVSYEEVYLLRDWPEKDPTDFLVHASLTFALTSWIGLTSDGTVVLTFDSNLGGHLWELWRQWWACGYIEWKLCGHQCWSSDRPSSNQGDTNWSHIPGTNPFWSLKECLTFDFIPSNASRKRLHLQFRILFRIHLQGTNY